MVHGTTNVIELPNEPRRAVRATALGSVTPTVTLPVRNRVCLCEGVGRWVQVFPHPPHPVLRAERTHNSSVEDLDGDQRC